MTRRTAAVLVVALALLGGACSSGGGDDDDDTSTPPPTIGRDGAEVVDGAAAITIGAPLPAYAITYRVEEVDGAEIRVTGVELTVQRPYRSRLATTTEAGKVISLRVTDFASIGEDPADADATLLTPLPAPGSGDVRGDLVAAVGTTDGEVRRVAGRECQVHHFGAPLTGGQVIVGDTTEECIDADGLLLEEVVHDGDRVVSRWVATDVDTAPTIDDDEFTLPDVEPTPADAGGGSLREADPTSRSQGTFYELPAPPEGFTHRGRYAAVPPQTARPDDPETRAQVIAGVVDVYERGVDIVAIDQGGTLGQVPPFGAAPNGTTIDGLSFGALAESIPTPFGGEVRVLVPPGRYVRVYGTLPVDDLVALVRSLQPFEGTGLVYR